MALLIVTSLNQLIFFEIKNNLFFSFFFFFFFVKHEFSYSEVCDLLRRFLGVLPAFLLPLCLAF